MKNNHTNCKAYVKSKNPLFRTHLSCLLVLVIICAICSSCASTESEPTYALFSHPDLNSYIFTVESSLAYDYEFDYYEVNVTDKGIAINVATDGYGELLYNAKKKGHDENYSLWVDAKDWTVSLYYEYYSDASLLGIDGIEITINVLDDRNHNNVLLVVSNGVILYDYMAS